MNLHGHTDENGRTRTYADTRTTRTLYSTVAVLLLLASCSGAQEPEPQSTASRQYEEEEPDDGMAIEGIRGTLRRDEVDPVMTRAAQRFQQCYAEAYMDHPYLVGDLSLHFTVGADGSVASVRTTASTLGSHDVEECILNIAGGLSFPQPHGGPDAEFDYGPMMMSSEDAHPVEVWGRDRVTEALELEENVETLELCLAGGSDGYEAALYIGPGGLVRSVGVIPSSPDHQDEARCLENALSGITFPDPGEGVVAKLTLEL